MKEVLITSSALILALLALRGLFRRAISRRVQYALWALVLVRLLIPVSLPAADFSLLTAAEPVGQTVAAQLQGQTVYVLPVNRVPISDYPMAKGLAPGTPVVTGESFGYNVVSRDGTTVTKYAEKLTAAQAVTYLWRGGMALMAACLLVTNLRFWRKLRKVRTPYTVEGCKHPVYLVGSGLLSPCLFGLLRPAIYLTPAAVETKESLRHVIAHESAHARHWDPLWSLLRCLCLAVYWFDPLVWIAAIASKADCELACDEGALKALGESERIPYGKTLLSLIPVGRGPGNPLLSATTMTAGKRRLKDRISRIAENRQTKAAALFAVAALALGICAVTFTGGRAQEGPRPLTGDELAYFNEEFFNGDGFNIRNQFLTSLYETPAEMDLFALFYNGAGLPETMTDTERQAVADAGYGGNDPGVDLTKCSAANLDAVLLETTGLTLAETNRVDLDAFTYLPAYDAYYFFHGDTNYRANVAFSAGEREGDVIRLYCTDGYFGGPNVTTCVTLEAQADGSYWFASHLYAERPAISTVYPEGEPALTIPLDGLTAYAPETVELERHTDDRVEQYENHMVYDDLFHIYRSTDGNVYAALAREPAAESDGTPRWDVACFFTFPADADPRLISCTDFYDLFGSSGAVIAYPGQISENQYNTINDYYYVENGEPVLLARAYGETALTDLDGDGETELCAAAGNTAQVFFQREGQVYEADVAALLADAWPQAAYLGFGSWDASRRSLPLSGEVPLSGYETDPMVSTVSAFRNLYFDGGQLLFYRDDTTYPDHIADGIAVPAEVAAAAQARVLDALSWWQTHSGGQNFVDGQWQDIGEPAQWDDWRITDLALTDTAPAYPELGLIIYRLGYELHTVTPEDVMAAGGMYILEDGWVGGFYVENPYLVFHTMQSSGPALLENHIPSDVGGSSENPMFAAYVAETGLKNGLLTPSEIRDVDLYYLFYANQTQFLNLLGEYAAAQQTAALDALADFAASFSGSADAALFADGLQNLEWNSSALTERGRLAYDRLLAAVARSVS